MPCPGQRVRVGWQEPGTLDNSGPTLRCWAVCDGCGQVRYTEADPIFAAYPEFVERIEESTLQLLHG